MLVRVETRDGMVKWRKPPDLEHGTLCRAFGLDPCSTYFELPSSARGVGSASVGAGGNGVMAGSRLKNGFVFQGPRGDAPIGTITLVREGERFRDDDPTNSEDFLRLSK
jgi:hypothetical protein